MKKVSFISMIVFFALAFVSCQKEPVVNFTVNKTTVVTDEKITFNNLTVDGSTFEWDFGDGNKSNEKNPIHSYKEEGKYNVVLKAFSKNGKKSSSSSVSITVKKANAIKYDGKSYGLDRGYIERWGDWGGNYCNFDVYLVSDGITITKDNYFGLGDFIYLELWSSSYTNLTQGTYTFSDNEYPLTFSASVMGIHYNIGSQVGSLYLCNGGSVKISQNENVYTFDILLTLDNGKTVTAYYEGTTTFIDNLMKKITKKSLLK